VYLRSSTWTIEPAKKGLIQFAKEIIKTIGPEKILKDVGDNLNDVVDIKINYG
jgi:uncharacterized protein YpiB (UPF0302 family)